MRFRPGWLAALAATALCNIGAPGAIANDEFLAPEKAFAYLVEADGDSLKVYWNVAPGYYLYKSRMSLDSATPEVTLGPATYPRGESHHDEYFGDQEIFRDDFVVTAPLVRSTAGAREMLVKVKWQGCADAGLCYPITVWDAKVTLPEASK